MEMSDLLLFASLSNFILNWNLVHNQIELFSCSKKFVTLNEAVETSFNIEKCQTKESQILMNLT